MTEQYTRMLHAADQHSSHIRQHAQDLTARDDRKSYKFCASATAVPNQYRGDKISHQLELLGVTRCHTRADTLLLAAFDQCVVLNAVAGVEDDFVIGIESIDDLHFQ